MIDDFKVTPRSAKDIEAVALAWRDTLGVPNEWAPDMVRIVECELPRLIPAFALLVRADAEMGDAEAYAEFNPPHIAVRDSVYRLASQHDGRGRMTFAHELGHLVMHPGAAKLRTEGGHVVRELKAYESAEWQAKKFASLFLMPKHIAIEFNSARQMSECCKVSLQAAQIRFSEVELAKRAKPLASCVVATITDLSK
jgi:Zn-dependent peptidase ImmA (M78 family)